MRSTAPKNAAELEALETREWLESLDYVLQSGGPARVGRLLALLADHARRSGVKPQFTANTPYINTIPAAEQPPFPQTRISAHQKPCGGTSCVVARPKAGRGHRRHISTYASAATLYEVGLNHLQGKATTTTRLIYLQGSGAGIYARALSKGASGRAAENFRRELRRGGGLSSSRIRG